MVNQDIVIKRKDNGYMFFFRCVSGFKVKKSQPAIVVPLVNLSAANTFLFRFFGPSEVATFSFAVFDDGTDASMGTNPTPIITVKDQCLYLKDVIFSENFDIDYELYDLQDVIFPIANKIEGLIVDMDFDFNSYAKVFVPGTIMFQRGKIGDL